MALSFRKKNPHKELKRRILLLCIVFAVAFAFFEVILNTDYSEVVYAENEPTLPVVSVISEGEKIGQYFGYKTPMELAYVRDSMVPLSRSLQLTLVVDCFGTPVDAMEYEIRSMDGNRKIADTIIESFQQDGDTITTEITLENLMEEGTEYFFILTLRVNEQDIYYYIRILFSEQTDYKACLEFTKYFHNTALSDSYNALATYIEPDGRPENGLTRVNINSTLNQICWKDFDGERINEPRICFDEITENYCALTFYYQMQRDGIGRTQVFDVEEYFRVRQGNERMFLLDYERTMNEVVTKDSIIGEPAALLLGQAAFEPSYLANEMGTVIGFVWGTDLYEYDMEKASLMQVFSFRKDDIYDIRRSHNEHNLRILRIDENGNMDFVVYGYMNCGNREGMCGITLYHYDSEQGEVQEEAFIQSGKSYQLLQASFLGNIYQSSNGEIYLKVDDKMLIYDIINKNLREMSLPEHAIPVVSDDGRYLAWNETAEQIAVMDLDDQSTVSIDGEGQEEIQPLLFLGNDIVYGSRRASDERTDGTGTSITPLYSITIKQIKRGVQEVLKTYAHEGVYIKAVEKESPYNLILHTLRRLNEQYIDAGNDSIQNTSGAQAGLISIENDGGNEKNQMMIRFNSADDKQRLLIENRSESKVNILNDDIIVKLPTFDVEGSYYVYASKRIIGKETNLPSAISLADQNQGFVVDDHQHYIWQYGRAAVKESLTPLQTSDNDWDKGPVEECLDVLFNYAGSDCKPGPLLAAGQTPLQIMEHGLENEKVINLKGLNLTQVLTYVSRGYPVYVGLEEGEALLLVGYDSNSITVFDPHSNRKIRKDLRGAAEEFAQQGNQFISYIKGY